MVQLSRKQVEGIDHSLREKYGAEVLLAVKGLKALEAIDSFIPSQGLTPQGLKMLDAIIIEITHAIVRDDEETRKKIDAAMTDLDNMVQTYVMLGSGVLPS